MKKILFLMLGLSASTQASISTFDGFLTTTNATSTAPLPNTGLLLGSARQSQAVGDLTFFIAPPFFGLFFGTLATLIGPASWTTHLNGNQIGISEVSSLNIDLSSLVFSFGFEFVELEFAPNDNRVFVGSIFGATLFGNDSFIESFTFNVENGIAVFYWAVK